jgi:6-pyruvoyltetrahydropterin/6-carboxytetrahydropterin synthase
MVKTTVTTIARRYHFEAAHYLPHVADDHKCKRMHGHNYEVEIWCVGPVLPNGFLIDFWDLDKQVQPLIDRVDHRCLNDVDGLENPTAELIAAWFLAQLNDCNAFRVRVYETKDCWADCTDVGGPDVK